MIGASNSGHGCTENAPLERFLDCVRAAAAYGLLEEVRTTPKPGLVDLHDNGSHRDMCYDTFVASTEAVVPYLTDMARLGCLWDGPVTELFPAIRPTGVKAEAAMFAATGGVNTHKGIIFSLGIIAACLGYDYRRTGAVDPCRALELGGLATRDWLEQDFDRMKTRPPVTHGEHLFAEYGYRGIRGEAQEGFPALRLFALPAMKRAMTVQPDANRARLYVLLTLMANVDDTNILIRSNPRTLEYAQEEARRLLLSHPVITDEAMEELAALNREFIARNISPGGCADLLAIAIFFERLEQLVQK
ncbi:MAG: triphosphoribosyl-dephospho-CoA synthase [Enterocloster asparagiformis]|nr:triphosphoribosyl-dephospho-CoA synthase [Enterocloster asparagiformis]